MFASFSKPSCRPQSSAERPESWPLNLQRQQISQILQHLQYPSILNYCHHCTKEIKGNDGTQCQYCSKTFHQSCKAGQNQEIRGLCRFCERRDCMNCKKDITLFDKKVQCSICLRSEHQLCWNMPSQLLHYSRIFYQKKNHLMGSFNRMVCEKCRKNWKNVQLAKLKVRIDGKNYQLWQIDHPSPSHFNWQPSQEQSIQKIGQVLELSQPVVQKVLSIYIPPNGNQTIQSLQTTLLHDEQAKFHKILILSKWSTHQKPIWQYLQTVLPFKKHILGFLFRLSLNALNLQTRQLAQQYINSYIENKVSKHALWSKVDWVRQRPVRTPGRVFILKTPQLFYYNYLQDPTKPIQFGSTNIQKYQTTCSLINTILLTQKKTGVVFIFTPGSNLKKWTHILNQRCPLHTIQVVSVRSAKFNCDVPKKWYSILQQKPVFYSGIYLIDYASFSVFVNYFNIKEVISYIDLLVMEQPEKDISIRAEHYFTHFRNFKVRIVNTTNKNSLLLNNIAVSDSTESKLSLEKKEEDKIQNVLRENLSNTFKIIIKEHENAFEERKKSLDDLQRIVFLRFVMSFGMEFQNEQLFYQGVIALDKSAFETESQQNIIAKLKQHTIEFLSIVYSNVKKQDKAAQKVVEYYCFGLQPIKIFQRILAMNHLKQILKACSRGQEPAHLPIEKQSILSFKFILMIIQTLFLKGYGKWQAISRYAKIWQENTQKMTLHDYFCKNYKTTTLQNFITFIQKVLTTTVTSVSKIHYNYTA